ncbi:MAG: S-layer homology domain-containing protein [Firmicutes bacterium]|nr:S-layer homology domain-containing protein [Bacillota bacterium]
MERKLLSLILALVMVLGVFSPVFAEETVEATEAKPAGNEAVDFLKEQGIIKGDNKGDLLLDQDIDRAQFAAILTRAAGKEDTAQAVAKLGNRFPDIAAAHWANGYANVAFESGWMKGNEKGEFMPEKNISFAEIATTLVRYLNIDTAGYSYPTSYIAKAIELGLFKDVSIQNDYQANAPRKEVFQMLYNAISKDDFGKYNVYKMIVLENSRVAQLSKDQIKAEVISIVQMANNVDERGTAKVGEQMVLNLVKDDKPVKVEGGLADSENLFGRVADFTLNEKNEIVKITVDESYPQYVAGFQKVNEKVLKLAGKEFNVRVDERYYPYVTRSDRDDRVYRTYVTSGSRAENYNYQEFAKKRADGAIKANFGRVTVKDGMVLFVDAWNYNDIAPVQKVEREGKDVYYWNDARNAAVERMEPAKRVIAYNEKEGFKNYSAKEIKADDVIHWMNGFTLVRTDAPVTGKLDKTYENADGEFAVLEGVDGDFYLNTLKYSKAPFQSVFAYDDQHYRTLDGRRQIEDMRGSDVKFLLDVFGDVQLVTSHNKYNDRIALLDKTVSSKGMEFFAPNAPEEHKFRLNDDWDTNYYRDGKWNRQSTNRFDSFGRLELVYVEGDEENNAKLVASIDKFAYDPQVDPAGAFVKHPWKSAAFDYTYGRDRFINIGGVNYRYSDQTDIFVIGKNSRGERTEVEKATLENIKKYNENNKDLKAMVITEEEFDKFLTKELDIATYGRFDNRSKFAKIIVFTDAKGADLDLLPIEYARIDTKHNWSDKVTLEVAQGKYEEYLFADGATKSIVQNANVGDFVAFREVKNSDPKKAKVLEVIDLTRHFGKVEYNNGRAIKLENENDAFEVDGHTKEFDNALNRRYAMVYVVNGWAEVIVYTDRGYVEAQVTEADKARAKAFAATVDAQGTPFNLTAVEAAWNALTPGAQTYVKEQYKTQYDKYMNEKKATEPAFQTQYNAAIAKLKKLDANAKLTLAQADQAQSLLDEIDAYKSADGSKLALDAQESTLTSSIEVKISGAYAAEYAKQETEIKNRVSVDWATISQRAINATMTGTPEYTAAQTAADAVATSSETVTDKSSFETAIAKLQTLESNYNTARAALEAILK